ncbi:MULTISPECIES: ABC transporter ATP-binding protein [Clostridium]|uniref:ABC transporter ATP-binding protein n=1 Tax=Clostridium aquiflavi TaxID=3073603 RepID=A0ABU1EKP2_9CLOT|nr:MULTISPECIES: ABC transporter ATP-binding protein [unclassified Clostridium]MDR5588952.1 ABC transporter ATP-binding protein [Clostridium sp. 5N-1]NFG63492.1 ABC transporter ATP-binding protein [Clostridium botulinum]NFQ08107.1 ABC transporter ATP-binding protein [Clostridium botulinum]
MNALEISNLNKKFKDFSLENINLSLPKGYILGYVGQNGAGKTTTIKLIMQQLKADSGEISVFGKKYKGNEVEFKDMIGFVGDECYFPQGFKLKDVINTLKDFYPSFNEDKFNHYVNLWELPRDKKIKEFSKGMKIKLTFASIFARKTKLLILDEPTSGLDPVIRNNILELLQEYIEDGEKSVLFSTHITSDLEKIADYIFFINKGKMIFNDTKDNILEKHFVVKGGKEDLTTNIKDKLIGYKKSNVGFQGVIYAEDKKYLDDELLIEKPSIEEIIVFYINSGKEDK